MAVVYLAFMFGPLLGAAAGYLVDGVAGATSGFLIPMGPAVVACLFGGLACSSPTQEVKR